MPKNADISQLEPLLKEDFAFMKDNTILVRVSSLPVGSLIEIEFICDSAKFE